MYSKNSKYWKYQIIEKNAAFLQCKEIESEVFLSVPSKETKKRYLMET